jgi:hypothetical protein
MLWPEKRRLDKLSTDKNDPIYRIDRTTTPSNISIPAAYVPETLRPLSVRLHKLLPALFDASGGIVIGPFPKGLPVNLLANTQPLSESNDPIEKLKHVERLVQLLVDLKRYLAALPANATDEQRVSEIGTRLGPALLALNKCPDFEVNRGHYFGTGQGGGEPALSDDDKRALVEFLKTF